MQRRVLITGANGFIGRHLERALKERGIGYRGAVRCAAPQGDSDLYAIGDLGPLTDWAAALDGVEAVIHLAGRTHVLKDTAQSPHAEFMRVNADGTARLVTAAVSAGVKRFIYVSSVKVLGDESGDLPFTSASVPRPRDSYAESKLAGEQASRSNAAGRMEVAVVRPPLVYGPTVRANFLRLLRWVDRQLPLPFGAVDNRRSLVNVWNLCDLLLRLLDHPAASKRNWLVSDGNDVSTAELIRQTAGAMGRHARLIPIQIGVLGLAGRLLGRATEFRQLCASLSVDISDTRQDLGWRPTVSMQEGLLRTVNWYRSAAAQVSGENLAFRTRA